MVSANCGLGLPSLGVAKVMNLTVCKSIKNCTPGVAKVMNFTVCESIKNCTPYMEQSTFQTSCTVKTASMAFCGLVAMEDNGLPTFPL